MLHLSPLDKFLILSCLKFEQILAAVVVGLGLGLLHLIVSVKSVWARQFHHDDEPKKILHYEKVNHLHHYQHKHFFDKLNHHEHNWDRSNPGTTNEPYSSYYPSKDQIQQQAHEYAVNAVKKRIEEEITRTDSNNNRRLTKRQ